MTTVYFRIQTNHPVKLLFTPENSPSLYPESLLVEELAPRIDEPGVYKAELVRSEDDEPWEVVLEDLADADQTVALVFMTRQDDGTLSIEQTHIDNPNSDPTEEEMEILASVASEEGRGLAPNEPTWLFLAM